MEEVRRGDGELCGHVELTGETWRALVLFGALLGPHKTREDAVAQVLSEGLTSLAERWVLHRNEGGEDEVVCIQEASATSITLALGYYSMPGVPTLRLSTSEMAAGDWSMHRMKPPRR